MLWGYEGLVSSGNAQTLLTFPSVHAIYRLGQTCDCRSLKVQVSVAGAIRAFSALRFTMTSTYCRCVAVNI